MATAACEHGRSAEACRDCYADRRVAEIARDRDRLREALLEYGRHARSCMVFDLPTAQACTCGFHEALHGGGG